MSQVRKINKGALEKWRAEAGGSYMRSAYWSLWYRRREGDGPQGRQVWLCMRGKVQGCSICGVLTVEQRKQPTNGNIYNAKLFFKWSERCLLQFSLWWQKTKVNIGAKQILLAEPYRESLKTSHFSMARDTLSSRTTEAIVLSGTGFLLFWLLPNIFFFH